MSKSKDIGTAAERAVVRYLQAHGWPAAERRALRGREDAGDIAGTPGICWEVKGGEMAKRASDLLVADWLEETSKERRNAGADVGVLVLQRAGIGPANAGRWWAVMRLDTLLGHERVGIWTPPGPEVAAAPVRMLLADAVRLLRLAGYGTPLGGS